MTSLSLKVEYTLGAFSLNVDETLPLQGVTALLGHSGAGKSTLLSIIAGLRRPDSGRVRLGSDVLFDIATHVDVPPERRDMGCVLQRPCLFPHMSVQENCLYGAKRRALPVVASHAGQVMRWLDLTDLLERRPAGLSGGEQQRVALARVLLSRPRLLLLDEPLAAVDARRRDDVLPYLERVCAEGGVPVIYVSHAIDDVARLADRIVVLERGRVATMGDAHDVLSSGVDDVGFPSVNVLDGTVTRVDGETAHIDIGAASLVAAMRTAKAGDAARCVIRAADVMLARDRPDGLSADNVLACRLLDLGPVLDTGTCRVRLACGECELNAVLSASAVKRLSLSGGDQVYAVFHAPRGVVRARPA